MGNEFKTIFHKQNIHNFIGRTKMKSAYIFMELKDYEVEIRHELTITIFATMHGKISVYTFYYKNSRSNI